MLRCVAFDLDGVVIPSEPSFAMFERDYGITRRQFGEFFSGSYREAMLGAADLEGVLRPTLEQWNWDRDASSFISTWLRSCEELLPPGSVAARPSRRVDAVPRRQGRERQGRPGRGLASRPRAPPSDLERTLGRYFDGIAAP